MRKRRNHGAGFKARVALEVMKGAHRASELAAAVYFKSIEADQPVQTSA